MDKENILEDKNWIEKIETEFYQRMLGYRADMMPEEKKEILEWMDLILSLHIIHPDDRFHDDNHDRFMHDAAAYAHPDVMRLFIKHTGDVNAPNKVWQRPIRNAILRPAKTKQEKAEKRQMIRLLLKKDANLFIKDKYKKSAFSILPEEYHDLVISELFPSSKKWTALQRKTKLEQLMLADYGNFRIDAYLKDEPPSEAIVAIFKEADEEKDEYNEYVRQRSAIDMIYHFDDMCRRMVKSIFIPEFLKLYEGYVAEGQSLKSHLVMDLDITQDLAYEIGDDMAMSDIMIGYLAQALAHRIFDIDSNGKKSAFGNTTKMVKAVPRHLRNEANFNAATDDRANALTREAKEIYKRRGKSTKIIEWESLLDEPVYLDGYWIRSIKNSEELKKLAEDDENCWYGHLMACMMHGEHVFRIWKDGEEPKEGYAFATRLTRVSKKDGLEYDDSEELESEAKLLFLGNVVNFQNLKKPPEKILHKIHSFIKKANKDEYGDMEEFYNAYYKGAKERFAFYDMAWLLIGYNYKDETADDFRQNAIGACDHLMGKTIRNLSNVQLFQDYKDLITICHFKKQKNNTAQSPTPN